MLWVGVLSALPYAVACIGMVLLTRLSDRTGERKRYLVYCLLAAAVGYLLACLYSDSSLAMMAALVLATAGTFIAIPIFWTIPQSTFSGLAIATGTAAINSVGQLSGIVAPVMVGKINDLTGSNSMGMLSIAPLILIASPGGDALRAQPPYLIGAESSQQQEQGTPMITSFPASIADARGALLRLSERAGRRHR